MSFGPGEETVGGLLFGVSKDGSQCSMKMRTKPAEANPAESSSASSVGEFRKLRTGVRTHALTRSGLSPAGVSRRCRELAGGVARAMGRAGQLARRRRALLERCRNAGIR